jgi:transcriptional regulator with XRE-family HTH domain
MEDLGAHVDPRLVEMAADPTERLRELGAFIREQRASSRLSLRRLSELAGISNPYLSQIERGLRRPSAEILQQIAKGLAISAETLYVRAGILEADRDSDLEAHIHADPHLTPEQRQALIQIYRSFIGDLDESRVDEGPTGQADR